MGIKCPKCKSSDTRSSGENKMHCYSCSHTWKPYKHRGKKMKVVGDNILARKRRVMPGARTEVVGDNIIIKKRRVKKTKKKSLFW